MTEPPEPPGTSGPPDPPTDEFGHPLAAAEAPLVAGGAPLARRRLGGLTGSFLATFVGMLVVGLLVGYGYFRASLSWSLRSARPVEGGATDQGWTTVRLRPRCSGTDLTVTARVRNDSAVRRDVNVRWILYKNGVPVAAVGPASRDQVGGGATVKMRQGSVGGGCVRGPLTYEMTVTSTEVS